MGVCNSLLLFLVSKKKVLQWGKNIRDDIQSIKLTINDQIAMQNKNFDLQTNAQFKFLLYSSIKN